MTRYVLMTMLLAVPLAAAPAKHTLSFTKVWTHGHTTPGQISEIPAFDHKTSTIWVAGVVGVDVLDAHRTGTLVEHIDVTAYGLVNSVAIHNGLAALAIEAATRSARSPVSSSSTTRGRGSRSAIPVTVGALPDMLTFTHDGSKLLVANEATPERRGRHALYADEDPQGSVSIIDVETRTVIATAGFANVPQLGTNLRTNVGMDFEPEYIAVEKDGSRAFVTLQEANAIAVLDLSSNTFTEIIGLGAKDFSLPENMFDPKDNNTVDVRHRQRQGPVHAGRHRVLQVARPDLSGARQRRGLPRGQRRSFHGRKCTVFGRRSSGPSAHLQHGFFAGESVRRGRPLLLDSRRGRDARLRQRQHPRHARPTRAASTTTAAAATRAWNRRASR